MTASTDGLVILEHCLAHPDGGAAREWATWSSSVAAELRIVELSSSRRRAAERIVRGLRAAEEVIETGRSPGFAPGHAPCPDV